VSIESVLLTIGSYLVGSVPASYLAAKRYKGIDIRQNSAGHAGAGSIWHITPKRVSLPVIFFDFSKGIGMVALAYYLGMGKPEQIAVGLAAVLGHNWPVFLRFYGGRGILTSWGVIVIWWFPWAPVTFFGGATLTLLNKGSPLPVLIGIAMLPIVSWVFGQPLAVTIGFLVLLLIVVIKRLTAPKSAEAASVGKRELIISRLLFDRDIREKETTLRIIRRKKRKAESLHHEGKEQEKE
jgi:glycerol-3-phosphate acyltransferase PlsY